MTTHNNYKNDIVMTDNDFYDYNDYLNQTNTKTNLCISDHSIITAIYNEKESIVPQLFTTIRNKKMLTRENLTNLWDQNEFLPSVLRLMILIISQSV